MTDRFFRLTPQDTLFFRDGRPYEQQDDGLAQAHSLFPPHPTTLTGALRVAMARAKEWDGASPWTPELLRVLGDGPDMTWGALRFGPPLLLRRTGPEAWEPIYPAPLTLRRLAEPVPGRSAFVRLRPGEPVRCDLGPSVRLPVLPEGAIPEKEAPKPGGLWLTATGLALACAAAPLPADFDSHVVPAEKLWSPEARVGLELAADSRTAVRGRLYAPVHVRLNGGVALGQAVAGLPPHWEDPTALVPLGGEHRFTHLEPAPAPTLPTPPLPAARTDDGRVPVSLCLLSPAFVGRAWLTPGAEPVPGARLVSAVLGDPLPIGGWDGRRESKGPRALRPALPAGSTFFLEVEPAKLEALRQPIGDDDDTRHGFGSVAAGTWPEGAA